jgi:hypothetical protein
MPGPDPLTRWTWETTPLKFFHCTTPRGLKQILEAKVLQCFSWDEGGAGDHGVYGKAFISGWGDAQADHSEYQRMMLILYTLGKNISGFVFECSSFVKVKPLNSRGFPAEVAPVTPGLASHKRKDHRHCIHPSDLRIEAIWYVHNAGSELHR